MDNNDCAQYCDFNGNKTPSPKNRRQFGPITVRVCRKTVPTLKTGRRSKNLILVGEEAEKREKRRERNREGAKKLKEKRQQIEEELNQKIQQLESLHSHLKDRITQLNERKQILLYELNEQLFAEIDDLLSNDDTNDISETSDKNSSSMSLFDDAFEEIVNIHMKDCFDSAPDC